MPQDHPFICMMFKNILVEQNKLFLKYVADKHKLDYKYLLDRYHKPEYYLPVFQSKQK